MRVALINPPWTFERSIYFGCREPHLPLEYGYAKALLDRDGHETLLLDGQLDGMTAAEIAARAVVCARHDRHHGLSALEAAHAGCALVLGDIDSLREIWGWSALFVPPDDRDALRDAIMQLIEDPGLWSEMAARARTRAAAFTPRKMALEYLDAYVWLREQRDAREVASHVGTPAADSALAPFGPSTASGRAPITAPRTGATSIQP